MFKKLFKKKEKEVPNNKNILIAALLIHAAKIDLHYTDIKQVSNFFVNKLTFFYYVCSSNI